MGPPATLPSCPVGRARYDASVNLPLQGKRIVIIGGTTGLGLSAAKSCIAAGAHVVTVGNDPETTTAAEMVLGDKALAFTGDATDPTTAERAIGEAVAAFGGFDGLYHVAGGSGRKYGDGPLHDLTDDGWRHTLDINLTAAMLSNRAAVRAFMERKTGGSILNIGSVLGWSPSPRHFATHAYAAAKAAIAGFSRSIAAYYAPHGIRVNVLAPALVDTPMAKRAAENEDIRTFIAAKQPLDGGRIGQPEDLDAAVVWFLSDASKFCTGQVLAVDGGWSVSEAGGK
jgi:NAD(P)-dependent dehydrogenase (short-subunit alcohol dehydrogenase family)